MSLLTTHQLVDLNCHRGNVLTLLSKRMDTDFTRQFIRVLKLKLSDDNMMLLLTLWWRWTTAGSYKAITFTLRSMSPICHTGTQNVLGHREINKLCHSEICVEYNSSCYDMASAYWYMSWHKRHLISLWLHLSLESIWCWAEKQQNKKCNHWSIEVHQALNHCWTNCTGSVKHRETCWSSCSGSSLADRCKCGNQLWSMNVTAAIQVCTVD